MSDQKVILEWADKLPKAEGWIWCGKWGGSVYPTERHSHASSDCPGPHHELRVARELSATDQPLSDDKEE